MSDTTLTDELWSLPAEEVLARLDLRAAGLTAREAAERLTRYGPNRLDDSARRSIIVDILRRFANPLVLILMVAAAISAATGDPASLGIIATMVVLSVALDTIQERRAASAAAELRQKVALKARVLRDGQAQDLPATDLVPGDIIVLSAGDLVPADCRLLESKDLFVNQSLLTGKSYPSEKNATAPKDRQEAVRENAALSGSSIVSGTAKALVVATGRTTQLAGISHTLQQEPPPTAFALGLRSFGFLIMRLTVLLVLFVLLINLALHRPLIDSFLFALALAVGLTPELLPMIVSVTLAHGAMRMAKKDVIVKRLPAIHDLGSMDVLCSDKTGTLTEARIARAKEIDLNGAPSARILELAYLNAAFETGLKSPLDEAILDAKRDISTYRKIDEVPFDFERRRVSVLVEKDGKRRLIVKGAPEDILKLATHYQLGDNETQLELDAAAQAKAHSVFQGLGGEGLRVLGVAWRDVAPDCDHAGIADEANLVFAGFAAFYDPPKESARRALDALAQLGVAVKIVTGDNELVTQHVCRELGIEISGLLTGPELFALSDEALSARLRDVNLFCRVTPAQKARIIGAFRNAGHVVGYLGDGINDAPSLHAADVALSVEGAADVAKEAASMILLKNDLGVIAEGVREGRRTFGNIMKYVMMATSSNFGNMFSMAGGSLFLPFLPMLPIQILLNNLLYDLSETALPLDTADEAMMAKPRHWDMRTVRNFMLILGPVSSLFDFLTFALLLRVFGAGEALFHTGWFVESLATQVLVIFVIRTSGSLFASRPHPLLVASSLATVLLGVILPYTPIGDWLGFVTLPPLLLLALAGMTGAYLLAADLVKRLLYTRLFAQA